MICINFDVRHRPNSVQVLANKLQLCIPRTVTVSVEMSETVQLTSHEGLCEATKISIKKLKCMRL